MRTTLIGIWLFCLTGCEDFNKALNTDRKPITPPGIASSEDIADVQDLAAGRSVSPTAPETGNTQPQQDAGNSDQADTPPTDASISEMRAKIVDLKRATAANPKLVVIDNKIRANDPLSALSSAYATQTVRIHLLNFKNTLKTHKALNGRNPTFEEFLQMAEQHKVEFKFLKPYRMYGYDSEAGDLVILEDKAEKIRTFKEKGIPVPLTDKQYE